MSSKQVLAASAVAVALTSLAGPVAVHPVLKRYSEESTLPVLSGSVLLVGAETGRLAAEDELKWTWSYVHPITTRWLRLHVVITNMPARGWSLWVFDSDIAGSLVETITAKDLTAASGRRDLQTIWTRLIWSRRVRLELHSEQALPDTFIRVERCNYEARQPAPKAIDGDDEREDLVRHYGRASDFYLWSSPIAYVSFQKRESGEETNCTGFLVSQQLLLTNNHCLSEEVQLRTASAEFFFESDPLQPILTIRFGGIVGTDQRLDYTLLRLAKPVGNPVRLAKRPLRANQSLILIQHPNGLPKMISATGCLVAGDPQGGPLGFGHRCDSEGGSSGAPLMDRETGNVVGVHHIGQYDPRTFRGLNFGTPIAAILKSIQAKSAGAYAEIAAAMSDTDLQGHAGSAPRLESSGANLQTR